MTITSNGLIGTVDPNSSFLEVLEGEVTITGDDGGFNVTLDRYMRPDADYSLTPVTIGRAGYDDASLTLVGGGSGVAITIEDPNEPGFSANVAVGANGSSNDPSRGTLNIINGARLVSDNSGFYDPDIQDVRGGFYNINIGRNNGEGLVRVDGAGSLLAAYGTGPRITVGRNEGGVGSLEVENGGEVRTGGLSIGRNYGDGAVTIDGAGSKVTVSSEFGLGDRFRGNDYSGNGPQVRVGRDGGTGAIEVSNGGEFTVTNLDGVTDEAGIQLGRGVDATGHLKVSGDGSTVNIRQVGPSDDAQFGSFFSIGRGGAGTVDVYDGGVVNVTGNEAFIEVGGDDTDGSVSGRTSYLNVRDGGVVNVDSGNYLNGGINIANNIGSSGVVNVDGAGSQININSDGDSNGAFLTVGRRGEGVLNVTNGGQIVIDGGSDRFPVFFVGSGDGNPTESANSGYATISGMGSSVTVRGDSEPYGAFAAVARTNHSDGTLIINDYGALVVEGAGGSLEIAGLNGTETGVFENKGLVRVGTGGSITVSEKITVSGDIQADEVVVLEYGGDGSLYVDIGGVINAQYLAVGDQGFLQIDGGTINSDVTVAGELQISQNDEATGYTTGFATINGSLNVTRGALLLDINNETVDGASQLNSDRLTVDGDVTIDGAVIDVTGTNLTSAIVTDGLAVGDTFEFIASSGDITASNLGQFDLEVLDRTGFNLSLFVDERANGDVLVGRVDSVGEAKEPNEPTDQADVISTTEEGGEVNAGGGEDTVIGGGGNDTISGGDDADSLNGGAGADSLSGDAGNDVLVGGAGGDVLSGGRGADTLSGGGGKDSLEGSGGRDVLEGGGGADQLKGGGGRDMLEGGGGRDMLDGGGGRDMLDGGGGRDTVDGGGGRDVVDGGGGRDMVSGGRGADELTGGGGRDVFVFDTGDGRDTITDFRQRQDRIEIQSGADSFDDLAITQVGDDVLIRFSNVRITVEDDQIANFTAADFIF